MAAKRTAARRAGGASAKGQRRAVVPVRTLDDAAQLVAEAVADIRAQRMSVRRAALLLRAAGKVLQVVDVSDTQRRIERIEEALQL